MQFILFLFYVVSISFSGVASPGPLTFLTISSSYNNKNAGVMISLGHAIVEIPLVLLISLGTVKFLNSDIFKATIGFLGSFILVLLGIKSMIKMNEIGKETHNIKTSLLFAGSLATISNPYFFIWWTTIGTVLIMQALNFGKFAVVVFLFIHLLCDFSWYFFLSKIIFKTKKVFSTKKFSIISKVCGVILIIFGLFFIRNTIKLFLN